VEQQADPPPQPFDVLLPGVPAPDVRRMSASVFALIVMGRRYLAAAPAEVRA
jgi:hypothetical protein